MNNNERKVQDAYTTARAEVEAKLGDLQAILKMLDTAHEAHPAHWTVVGDLNSIKSDLTDITERYEGMY